MKEDSAQIYCASNGTKIVVVAMAVFFLFGGIFMTFSSFITYGPNDLGRMLLLMIFGVSSFLGSIYVAIGILRIRIEVQPDRICVFRVFQDKEIMLDDITGYRVIPGKSIIFYSENPKQQIYFLLMFDSKPEKELISWMQENLKNLDEVDAKAEMEAVLEDSRLGSNEVQRKQRLRTAGRWAKTLNIFSLGVGLLSFFYPKPYELVIGILILLPFICIGSWWYFGRAIKFNAKRDDALPSIDIAFLMPIASLGYRAICDWYILEWMDFWLPFFAFTFFLWVLLFFCSVGARKKVGIILLDLLFCGAYGYGVTTTLNSIMDQSSPIIYESHIINKRISRGSKSTTYYMTLAPWGPVKEQKEFTVDRSAYDRRWNGDEVKVYLRSGALDIPWYSIY